MLDTVNEPSLIDRLWQATPIHAALPPGEDNYFELTGPLPKQYESRRGYHRFYYRERAVLSRGKLLFGVFAKDLSRDGIGFVCPEQLFPTDRVMLVLPGPLKIWVQVERCRRLGPRAFDCGTTFLSEASHRASNEAIQALVGELAAKHA